MTTRDEVIARFANNIIEALGVESWSAEDRDEKVAVVSQLIEDPVSIYMTAIALRHAQKKVRHSLEVIAPGKPTHEQTALQLERQLNSLMDRAFKDYEDREKRKGKKR